MVQARMHDQPCPAWSGYAGSVCVPHAVSDLTYPAAGLRETGHVQI